MPWCAASEMEGVTQTPNDISRPHKNARMNNSPFTFAMQPAALAQMNARTPVFGRLLTQPQEQLCDICANCCLLTMRLLAVEHLQVQRTACAHACSTVLPSSCGTCRGLRKFQRGLATTPETPQVLAIMQPSPMQAVALPMSFRGFVPHATARAPLVATTSSTPTVIENIFGYRAEHTALNDVSGGAVGSGHVFTFGRHGTPSSLRAVSAAPSASPASSLAVLAQAPTAQAVHTQVRSRSCLVCLPCWHYEEHLRP